MDFDACAKDCGVPEAMEKITLSTVTGAEGATMQSSGRPMSEDSMSPSSRARMLLARLVAWRGARASESTQGTPPMTQAARERIHHDRPLVPHAKERVAFSIAAREISDYTAALIPASTDRLAIPGESITQARQVRRLALDLLTMAVLLERIQGRSWPQIAASLGESEEYTRGRWMPVEEEWQRDDKFADRRKTLEASLLLPRREVPVTEDAIRKAAEVLDQWCVSRQASAFPDADASQNPVTDGIIEK